MILSKNMIKSAEADIISPTVTAEDPLALLGSIILILKEVLGSILCIALKFCVFDSRNKGLCRSIVAAG